MFSRYAGSRRSVLLQRLAFKRNINDIVESSTGVIDTAANEGILYFGNIFPLRTAIWDIRHSITELDKSSFMNRVTANLPKDLPITIKEVFPRLKEGGAFLKFSMPEGLNAKEVERSVQAHLHEHVIRPWFSPFSSVKSFLVRGKPWLEDLNRFPSQRLRVEFNGGSLSEETVYSAFRRYGKIAQITLEPGATPKSAILIFHRIRSATAARNCLHNSELSGTNIRILYDRILRAHHIRDWIFNHPRVTIPAGAALLATVAVAIFDPIRMFFIEQKVTQRWHPTRLLRWLKANTLELVTPKKVTDETTFKGLWSERTEKADRLKSWLDESTETFIVVQGPRGSGKRELVFDQVLKDRKRVLTIDCEPVIEANSDAKTIEALAAQTGYQPVFTWINSISSMVDLGAQAAIGQKAGFSETLDAQLRKVLQSTASALKAVALKSRKKQKSGSSVRDEDYLEIHPEERPIVVIDNYLLKSSKDVSIVNNNLLSFAGTLVDANIAHVILLTSDGSYGKVLNKAQPDRIVRSIQLGDATPEVAKKYVLSHLEDPRDEDAEQKEPSRVRNLEQLDECIQELGGRLVDLEFLARRIRNGEEPHYAVEEIIQLSASEILKFYFFEKDATSDRLWTTDQAWMIVKYLSKNGSVRYNELLLDPVFKSNGEQALGSMEQAEMITIISERGRPSEIRPGKPVYLAAFNRLVKDQVLSAKMEVARLTSLAAAEAGNISKYESELSSLAALPKQPKELSGRVDYLLRKLRAAQSSIEEWESAIARDKNVLRHEY